MQRAQRMFSLADNVFWPHGFPIFDFSLVFEESILQILPSSSFILFGPAIILHYRQTNARIRQNKLLWTKVVCRMLTVRFG